MSMLVWVFGCVIGAVTWQAVLRLPGSICSWLCSPFEKPSRATEAFGLIAALLFLSILVTILLHAEFIVCLSFSPYVDDSVEERIEATVVESSIAGFVGSVIVSQLLTAFGSNEERTQA